MIWVFILIAAITVPLLIGIGIYNTINTEQVPLVMVASEGSDHAWYTVMGGKIVVTTCKTDQGWVTSSWRGEGLTHDVTADEQTVVGEALGGVTTYCGATGFIKVTLRSRLAREIHPLVPS